MSAECVFGCRHPLWGGAGECITVDDSTVDESCACEAGYASRDSFGNPSCVPFEVRHSEQQILQSTVSFAGRFFL